MAPKRLTRKEIKEDPIEDALKQLVQGLSDNAKLLAGTVLAVALIFAAVYSWETFSTGRKDEIQAKFADALAIYHAPLESEIPTGGEEPKYKFKTAEERSQKALDAFKKLVDDYGGSKIGLFSRYYVALVEHDLNQTDQAESDLESLISNSSEPEITSLARDSLARIYLNTGKTQQAVEVWKQLLDSPDDQFPREGVLFNLAQAYEDMDNKEDALKEYRKLLSEYPQSTYSRQVQTRVEFLEAATGAAAEENPEPAAAESKPGSGA